VKGRKIKIGFIGGGNMGEAIISAILRKKLLPRTQIGLHEPDQMRLQKIKRKHKILSFPSNAELVQASQTVLLAVKPQQMAEVLNEIAPHLRKDHLILSIAAGLDTGYFQKRLPPATRLIRIMPNLCAMIGEGAAALYATPAARPKDRSFALKLFSAAGRAVFVDREELLDTVTAVSGSGPAFVFLFIDALIEAGERQKLPMELGKTLVLQTLLGATKMAEGSREPIGTMIERVASKGGTTEAGLQVMNGRDFRRLIQETIDAAVRRARELRQVS
jgi:pyrroline-5-carboxylate reductase